MFLSLIQDKTTTKQKEYFTMRYILKTDIQPEQKQLSLHRKNL